MRAVPRHFRLAASSVSRFALFVASSRLSPASSAGRGSDRSSGRGARRPRPHPGHQDADDRRLRPARLSERRRQHHLVHRRAAEVDRRQRLRAGRGPRARPSRLRQRQVNGFVFAAAQNMKGVVSTQAHRRRHRLQRQRRRRGYTRARGRGTGTPDGNVRAPGRVRAHGAESQIDRHQPAQVGRLRSGRRDITAGRRDDARRSSVLVAAGVGQLGRTRWQPRRCHVSRGVHRLPAGQRRADADRDQHDDRLPVDRPAEALCGSSGHRCARSATSPPGSGADAPAPVAAAPTIEATRSPRASGSCAAPATRSSSSSTITSRCSRCTPARRTPRP